ncbi:hypothetical protein LIER_10941 [Lithospermum erythrorhizon]|uniref:Uncharacterized protein n=1 Tax=Lithospermum erythrorhizon TaxID=34254 RepID=A0AAV3PQ88_LITER
MLPPLPPRGWKPRSGQPLTIPMIELQPSYGGTSSSSVTSSLSDRQLLEPIQATMLQMGDDHRRLRLLVENMWGVVEGMGGIRPPSPRVPRQVQEDAMDEETQE